MNIMYARNMPFSDRYEAMRGPSLGVHGCVGGKRTITVGDLNSHLSKLWKVQRSRWATHKIV